ncbi:hypothetical protein JHK85_043131 [Glycine max]|nr:hypothetical protein JHK85_043131 [Glycine max]
MMGTTTTTSSGGCGGGGDMNMNMNEKPAWLERLMAETFFGACGVHQDRRKNEKNVFCLHCCLSICPHCLSSHRSHPLLQVRRYVYHDVIRLDDLEKLIDCSNIQVDYMVYAGQSLGSILHRFDESDFAISQFEGLRVDGSEVTEEDTQIAPSSSYSNTEATSNSVISCEPNNNVKKGKANRFLPGIVLSLGSRRKGAPHRAPLS